MAKKKTTDKSKAKINPDLEGLSVKINSMGEVVTSYDIDKLNAFLNENVDDKKLRHREEDSVAKKTSKKPKKS